MNFTNTDYDDFYRLWHRLWQTTLKIVNDYDDYERPYEENRPGFCPDGPEIRPKTSGNGPGPAGPGPTGRAGCRGGPGWASGPVVLAPLAGGPGVLVGVSLAAILKRPETAPGALWRRWECSYSAPPSDALREAYRGLYGGLLVSGPPGGRRGPLILAPWRLLSGPRSAAATGGRVIVQAAPVIAQNAKKPRPGSARA